MSSVSRLSSIKIPGLSQVVPILAILMEVLWGYAWLVWVSGLAALGWAGAPVNVFSYIVLAVAVEILARFSLSRNWSLRRVRLVVLLPSLVLLILLVRLNLGGGFSLWDSSWTSYVSTHLAPLIVSLIFGFYFIWRGISVGRQRNTFSDLYRRFLIGLAAIVLLLVIWGITGGHISNIWSNAGIYTILFFGVGLLTLALANLDALRTELLQHQEAASSFSRRWLSLVVVLVLVILGLGIALASIFSGNIASTLVHALSMLGNWLLTGFIYLLYPVAFLASLLYYVAKFLISLLTHGQPPQQLQPTNMQDWQKLVQNQSSVQIPGAALLALKWGLITLVIVLVIYFLARILIRFSQGKAEEDVEEVHETLWSWNLFSADLRALLAWLFRWARRRTPAKSEVSSRDFAIAVSEEDSGRIFSIRELYKAWLWQERQIGTPRRQWETPYEYRQRLRPEIEKVVNEVDALTEAYIAERYSDVKTEPEKLSLLNHLWRDMRAKLSNPDQDKPRPK